MTTLKECKDTHVLYAECKKCKHSGFVDLDKLSETYPDLLIDDVKKSLVCHKCGNEDVITGFWDKRSTWYPGMRKDK